MNKLKRMHKIEERVLPNDVVIGKKAVANIEQLLDFLGSMLVATRKDGDRVGVTFVGNLMADLAALRDGIKVVIEE